MEGSVFNCTSQEITLFHNNYKSTEGIYGECGGVGKSIRSIRSDVNTTNGNSTNLL